MSSAKYGLEGFLSPSLFGQHLFLAYTGQHSCHPFVKAFLSFYSGLGFFGVRRGMALRIIYLVKKKIGCALLSYPGVRHMGFFWSFFRITDSNVFRAWVTQDFLGHGTVQLQSFRAVFD